MTHSLSRSFGLVIVTLATFGASVLLGHDASAQHRGRGRVFVRPAPAYVQPAPVYVQPAPVYFVRPAPVFVRPAPVVQRDEHGILVMGDTRLRVGQAVRAQWGASWFDAQVIAVEGDNVRIHYTGYDEMWNEVVPRHRLRIGG